MTLNSRERGEESERKVETALKILAASGDIKNFYHARKGGEVDGQHMDFIVFLKNRLAIPVQVKSGSRDIREHYKKYPYIFAFLARESHTPQKIAARLSSIFQRFLRKACNESKKYKIPAD